MTTQRSPIDAFIFDVGRVLHHFSFEPVLDELRKYATWDLSPKELFVSCRGHEYENGSITTDEFLAVVQERFGAVDIPQFRKVWTSIFTPMTEMLTLAATLRKEHRVFLLSNTNAMHWEFLMNEHRLHEVADGYLVSFEAGVSKPEDRIYAIAEERFALEPARTVFIDDLELNAATARSRGWNTIVHVDPATTRQQIEQFRTGGLASAGICSAL
ncbi:MAG: HAD family phosphatase [Deltaproteobacteria bacterium]|nr:HAD family phosphatase [Deltaproteobacteria bacterium]